MKLPKIKEDLLVQELDGEVLVYDITTHQSYCLNETAKIVFNACDGRQTFAEVKLPEEMIYLSLDELSRRRLIADDYVSPNAGLSRREVMRRVGLASMIALPLISSLIAPTAANAASGGQSADCANRGGTCIAGGGNLCANRANQRVTFFYYQNGGGTCQGTSFASTPNFPCGTTAETTSFDVCRVG